MHYTNESINKYIITNLTVLGGAGSGTPCGANVNNDFCSYSSIEKNIFCIGKDNRYKYYFYDILINVSLKEFYEDSNLNLSYLPEYKNLSESVKMTLYSTGYFYLSTEDIKNFKGSTNPFKKFNKYSKSISACSLICFIANFFFGLHGVVIIYCFFKYKKYGLATLIILFIITLFITICGLI